MKKHTKEEQVAEYLREGIVSGRLPRGRKVKQAEIAAALGLSITPVREAIKMLVAEGYLLGTSHRGVVVAPFDVASAREVSDLRVMLECRLAIAGMERITQAEIDALTGLQREFEEALALGTRDTMRSLNYRFHRVLYTLADLPQTLHIVNTLWARYPFDLLNTLDSRLIEVAKEHQEIISAVLIHDKSEVLMALRRHLQNGWEAFYKALRDYEAAEGNPLNPAPPDPGVASHSAA